MTSRAPVPHAHSEVFAHSHDAHAPEHDAHAPEHDEPGGSTHRAATMVATPEHVCEFAADELSLTVLYRALSGAAGELNAYDDAGSLPSDTSAHALYLPSHAPVDEHHGLAHGQWYRVAVAHRALHHLLGTSRLDLARPESMFRRLRPAAGGLPEFSQTFGDPTLAVELFVLAEDLRIDAAALRMFPGLAAQYRLAWHEALHDRPPLAMLTARDAIVEALTQFSLGATGVHAPTALEQPIARTVAVARRLLDPRASAESSAEAALRVYGVLAATDGNARYRSSRPVLFADLAKAVADDAPATSESGLSITVHPVPFRDVAVAGHVAGDTGSGLPPTLPALHRAEAEDAGETGDPYEGDSATRPGEASGTDSADATGAAPPAAARGGGGTVDLVTAGALTPSGPDEFVYPEWDHVAARYRRDWCLLRQSRARAEPSQRRHRLAMARLGGLLPGLVAALERVQPAGRDIVRRRPHGDDLDLDACIDALVDLRCGVEPVDQVFTSTEHRRRDVAVAFALDLSASTAEMLPPDPAEPDRVNRTIDLQRDAVALLVEALERVGDIYGVYGFSGSGRDDVRLSVVKDLDERRSPAMVHRLEGLAPDHTTRMGPAIRHLAARLSAVEAATRVLLIVSDGRPYDIDYGQEYGEGATIDYALADTGRALDEARAAGVRPYLVTVDSGGGDYLSRICDPREYHVIADARALPAALAQFYVVARAEAFRRQPMDARLASLAPA